MQALHNLATMPTKNFDETKLFSELEKKFDSLKSTLTEILDNKESQSFEAHEKMISQSVKQIGLESLSLLLRAYDVSSDMISVENQVYRKA